MSVRLNRWGHSTGLRLPVAILSAAGLAVGRTVTLRVLDNGDIRIRPVGQVMLAEPESAVGFDNLTEKQDKSVW